MKVDLRKIIEQSKMPKAVKPSAEQQAAMIEKFNACGYRRINGALFDVLIDYSCMVQSRGKMAGLIISGSIGCGKSFGVEVMAGVMPELFDMELAVDLTRAHQNKTEYEAMREPRDFFGVRKHLIIDDVGCEPCPFKSYGTPVNVIRELLEYRYLLWHKYRVLTIITTNLTKAEYNEIYGQRNDSRTEQAMNFVSIKGEDLRLLNASDV